MSITKKIQHYQRSIEKNWRDQERMMHCISKLYLLPVTVEHLEFTGVGKTVNSLRRFDGAVGDAAKALVAKWKNVVLSHSSSEPELDEPCVPEAPGSYSSDSPGNHPGNHPGNSENDSNRCELREESKDKSKSSSHKSGSSGRSSKHSHKGSSHSEATNSKHHDRDSVHKDRHSKTESKDHDSKRKRHSSKHDSGSERRSKSSKDSSHDSRKVEDSKDKSRADSNDCKVTSSIELCEMNEKENHMKRKLDFSGSDKHVHKKKKFSESESEEDNSRLVINSPVISSSTERSSSELETVSRKNTQSCDKTSEQKESSGKDKRGDKEREHKSKSESRKESHRSKDSKKDERRKESHSSSKHSSKSKSSHSSSSSKNHSQHVAEPDKVKKSTEDKSKTTKNNLKEPKMKLKINKEMDENEGIDSQSGTSFAEALGMCMMPPPSRKRNSNAPSSSVGKSSITSSESKPVSISATLKTENADIKTNGPSLLASNVILEPLNVNLASTLPDITPNYKPPVCNNPVQRKTVDQCLSQLMYTKNQRTKVYSGNKTGMTSVPSLTDLCIRILIENIDALEVTGGVPYYILKPVLERATPEQLFSLEHYNPYLIEDTDPLWEFHCSKRYRNHTRQEMESWREMYLRCFDETAAKLKALTENIKQSKQNATPVRSTIQVHDHYQVKPPRNVLRQQAKYGTARQLPVTVSEVKKKLIGESNGNSTSVSAAAFPVAPSRNPRLALKPTSSNGKKKTRAPLMAKALQLIKGRYRR